MTTSGKTERAVTVIRTAARRMSKSAIAVTKPGLRAAVRIVADHPEMLVYGSVGYGIGKLAEDLIRIPFRGPLFGCNARYVGAAIGGLYGYNRALLRRKLDVVIDRGLDGTPAS